MNSVRSRQGGILLGLSLLALMMFCLVTAAGLYFARDVIVGNGISIDTPPGSIEIHPHAGLGASMVGAPSYPGAKPARAGHGGAIIEWRSNDGNEDKGLAVTELITPDPVKTVAAYYQAKLPDWTVKREHDGEILLELNEGSSKRFIGITRKTDGTHIGVASVGEPASN
jgi:hypothetical protein